MYSIKQSILLKSGRVFRRNQAAIHPLKYLFWECTLRCNLNCLHCGSDCRKDSEVKDMPAQDFIKVIDTLPEICNPHETLIVMTGGEPLLRKDLEQVGLELYKREFPWGMVSNGYLLTRKRLESLMQSGLRTLTISLDGLAETHDKLRNKNGSFQKVIAAIAFAAKEEHLVFDVVTCVHSENLDELPEVAMLLESLGVKQWRLFSIFPKGRAVENNLTISSADDVKRLMDCIEATRTRGRIKASFGCEGFLGTYETKVRDHTFSCQAGITIASILADGGISACPSINKGFTQGNIYTDAFNDIWENHFDKMRDRSWAKTGVCVDCKQWKNCQGNGLHLRQHDREGPDYCHYKLLQEA